MAGAAAEGGRAGSQSRRSFATDGGGSGASDDDQAAPELPPLSVAKISSAANPYVKHLAKLRTSASYRGAVGRCLLVGKELLQEAAGARGEGGGGAQAAACMGQSITSRACIAERLSCIRVDCF